MILISWLPARVLRVVALAVAASATACGSPAVTGQDATAPRPTVVVTTPVLGVVIRDVVGDAAEVHVLMPEGLDPHDWEPSAKDIEAVGNAELVVVNGLGLEESLDDALDEAEAGGSAVFAAGDHVETRRVGDGGHGPDDEDHGAVDPHLWTDPVAMRDVVVALAPALSTAGIEVGGRDAVVAGALEDVDTDARALLAGVPPADRRLVTGHESLGYFAARFGFEIVGAIVPSASSLADTSAGELAALADQIDALGVGVIFTELGTPTDVVDAIAAETDTRVVELATHTLPEDGTYRTFVLDLASAIATGLIPVTAG